MKLTKRVTQNTGKAVQIYLKAFCAQRLQMRTPHRPQLKEREKERGWGERERDNNKLALKCFGDCQPSFQLPT